MKERKLSDRWEKKKIGELATYINGRAFKPSEWSTSGLPIIRIQNLNSTGNEINYFSGECDEKYHIKDGDILVSWSGSLGVFKWAGGDAVLNQHIFKVSFNKVKIEKMYFFYTMKSVLVEMERHTHGSTMKHITKSKFDNIEVMIPTLEIQKKVVEVLEKAENAIEKRRESIKLLDELVKSKFIEMFGDTMINSKGYDIRHLEDLADIVSGITKGRKVSGKQLKEVPYMRVANVKEGYIDWSEIKTIEATKEEIQRYCLLEGDVLMTEGGDPDKLGRGALLYNPPENCIHQNHIFRVRLNKKSMNPVFLSEYLKHPLVKRYFLKCAKQTTGIASINMSQLKKAPILLPPLELQNQFADLVKQVDKLKFEMEESLVEIEINFNSLMQKLLLESYLIKFLYGCIV